jgi:galactonate dehydratase
MSGEIRRFRHHSVRVSDKTLWLFVEIETGSGLVGVGEATLAKQGTAVLRHIERLGTGLVGRSARPDVLAAQAAADTLAVAAALSAIDMALHDIEAQDRGESLAALLGGARRERIPLYANINRRTYDRSPTGFAASARDAAARGFTTFKIAPFDEVTPEILANDRTRCCLEPGLVRIASVRDTIGSACELMVDCHWRLDEAAARTVLAAVESLKLYWLECPLVEDSANLAALVRLRSAANRLGIRLAGCEQAIGLAGFAPFLAAGAYDVMMPDVKYVGGLAEVMRVAAAFDRAGVDFSPHNPSGPVCHAASLQVSAAVPMLSRLELQFDESPLFDELVGGQLPAISGGFSALPWKPGLGVELRPESLDQATTWTYPLPTVAEGRH